MSKLVKPYACAECGSNDLLINMRARLAVVHGTMEASLLTDYDTDEEKLAPHCLECAKDVALAVCTIYQWNAVVCAKDDTNHSWVGTVIADTHGEAVSEAELQVMRAWNCDSDELEVVDCFNVSKFIEQYSK